MRGPITVYCRYRRLIISRRNGCRQRSATTSFEVNSPPESLPNPISARYNRRDNVMSSFNFVLGPVIYIYIVSNIILKNKYFSSPFVISFKIESGKNYVGPSVCVQVRNTMRHFHFAPQSSVSVEMSP